MPVDCIWTDDPIRDRSEDRLGRSNFIQKTVELLRTSYSKESSVVVGLVGPWGSGKTSIIDLATNELKRQDNSWIIANFSPWATSGTDGMLAEFHSAIIEAVPDKQLTKKLKKHFSTFLYISSTVAAQIPIAGQAASSGLKHFARQLAEQPSWKKAFDAVSSELRKLNQPILVVADDIDRLERHELQTFWKVIRLLGRFPGISYLIAYDEQAISSLLSEGGLGLENGGRAFLEKYVQHQIHIPTLTDGQILTFVQQEIQSAAGKSHSLESAQDGRLEISSRYWPAAFGTYRSIKRFGKRYSWNLSLHDPGEVDIVDLLNITLLHSLNPDLHAFISINKKRLTHRSSDPTTTGENNLLALVKSEYPSSGPTEIGLIKLLFPVATSSPLLGPTKLRIWDSDYFDRYFSHSIPTNDIPDGKVLEILKKLQNGDPIPLRSLLLDSNEEQKILIVRKIGEMSARMSLNSTAKFNLLCSLMSILPSLPDPRGLVLSPRENLAKYINEMLTINSDNFSEDQIELLLRSSDDPYSTVQVVRTFLSPDSATPEAIRSAIESIGGWVLDELMSHIQRGDKADETNDAIFLIHFLARIHTEESRERIRSEAGIKFSGDDYAARFVSTSYLLARPPVPRLSSFAIEGFQALTSFDDEFFHLGLVELDDDSDDWDISWAARKRYAQGRAVLQSDEPS